nr:hypothetical protein Iba_chr05fCG7400 [Ipomoea batatas]GMD95722.1 hypothetical protein Iba_chr15aCG15050 [Ipomoea batatas]GME18898.1 hypothetical protein Iba_scaffold21539CG0390 [Ipomoea batatas]
MPRGSFCRNHISGEMETFLSSSTACSIVRNHSISLRLLSLKFYVCLFYLNTDLGLLYASSKSHYASLPPIEIGFDYVHSSF